MPKDPVQGSIVIFSAYGTWTYAAEDAGLPDYCAKPPFECAFVLLILNSVKSFCFLCFTPLSFWFVGGRTHHDCLPVLSLLCALCCQECLGSKSCREIYIFNVRNSFDFFFFLSWFSIDLRFEVLTVQIFGDDSSSVFVWVERATSPWVWNVYHKYL